MSLWKGDKVSNAGLVFQGKLEVHLKLHKATFMYTLNHILKY